MGHSQDPVRDDRGTGNTCFFFFVATVVPRFILVIVTIAINFNERVRQREGEMRRTCDSVTVDS